MSSTSKRPWFAFYPADWLCDDVVRCMSPLARAGYMDLLCHAARSHVIGTLSPGYNLWKLSGLSESEFEAEKASILAPFTLIDGFLVQKRMYEDAKKTDRKRLILSESGKRGMEKRWGKPESNKVVITTLLQKDNQAITSNSHSHIDKNPYSPLPENGKTSPDGSLEKLKLRLGALFHRRPSTEWSKKEMADLRMYRDTPEADLGLLEKYYTMKIKREHDYRRKSLDTFLHNLPGEIDRARKHCEPKISSSGTNGILPFSAPPIEPCSAPPSAEAMESIRAMRSELFESNRKSI